MFQRPLTLILLQKYRDTSGSHPYILLSAKRRAYFCRRIAILMGGVSREFSKVTGSGVTLSIPRIFGRFVKPIGRFVKPTFSQFSGGRGCLEEGRLGVPGQVWEFGFLPSFASFPRENRSLRDFLWENAWKSQTSFFQTSAKRPVLLRANFVLTKDRNSLTTDIFVVKCTGRGLVVKRPGVLSKVPRC